MSVREYVQDTKLPELEWLAGMNWDRRDAPTAKFL